MIEFEDVEKLRRPVLIVAFAGWNDAADAATSAVDHLIEVWDGQPIGGIDPEDFYDFQVARPHVTTDDRGMRRITWPGTQFVAASPPGSVRDVVVMRGIEPSMRWRQFVSEVLAAIEELGVELVITLGALLSDASHTRPVPITGLATEPDLSDRLGLESSNYEGPTGILGVILDACIQTDMPAVSLWAGVPHYLPNGPNYKAALALVNRVEDLLELRIEQSELIEDASAWQRGAERFAEDDEEIAAYVEAYERDHDAASLPEASGDAIAAEFERYLKRRERDS
ncbi:MAG: PAC2 family protein [Marmoricola sp.]